MHEFHVAAFWNSFGSAPASVASFRQLRCIRMTNIQYLIHPVSCYAAMLLCCYLRL